jgi:ABC-2 type transport system permease protein
MQVFKAFFITVKKQFVSISIYFIIFLVLTVLLTGNIEKQSESVFKDTKVKMAVIDRDNSELSKSLYNYLNETQTIVTIDEDQESISDELFYRNIEYVLFINEGFEKNLNSGIYENTVENVKVPQSTTGTLLDNKIEQYLSILSTYLVSGYSTTDAVKNAQATTLITAEVTLHQTDGPTENRTNLYYFYTYIPYVLIGMLTIGLGEILITFRKKDLNARIKCSAMSNTRRNGELMLSSLLFSLACWVSYIVLSFILYRGDMLGIRGALFILNSFIFLLIAISLTYLISFVANTPSALNMASNIIGLGLSFLGGIFVPLQYMSTDVLRFSRLLPTYWYVKTSEVIDGFNSSSEQYQTLFRYMGIELIFVFAILVISVGLSKSKRIAQNG